MPCRRFRFLLMLFAALWLPVQAVAVQSMAFCRHGQAPATVAMQATVSEAADMAMADCPMHHGTPHAMPSPGDKDHGLGCDQCGFCHLAGAGVMSGPAHTSFVLAAARVFAAVEPHVPASNIPEPPQRPPRRVA